MEVVGPGVAVHWVDQLSAVLEAVGWLAQSDWSDLLHCRLPRHALRQAVVHRCYFVFYPAGSLSSLQQEQDWFCWDFVVCSLCALVVHCRFVLVWFL